MEIWRAIDEQFTDENVGGGLNSGAGLLHHLRDPSKREDKKGEPIDPGQTDKRQVFYEEELASVLMQGHRESEPNLCYVRLLFDGKPVIRSLTRDPTRATGAHAAIIGHCNEEDLENHLTDADKANGTANRFLWIYGLRSKRLKKKGDIYKLLNTSLRNDIEELKGTISFAKEVEEIGLSPDVDAQWHKSIYPDLERVPPGRIGALFERAPVMVLKIAAIFALSDRTNIIEWKHLNASLAIWQHADKSLRWIFRKDIDPDVEKILSAIKGPKHRLARTEISRLFQNNRSAEHLDDLLKRLVTNGTLAEVVVPQKKGRPIRYYEWKTW